MSAYLPPRENVPIFDSTLFGPRGIGGFAGGGGGGGGGGLTEAEADLLYLKWPNGQSSETLNGATTMSGTAYIAGATTLASTASVGGLLTANNGIDITLLGTGLTFPDNTVQTTAAVSLAPIVPAPISPCLFPAQLDINSFGQVTYAVSGSTPVPANLPITAATTYFNQNGFIQYDTNGLVVASSSGVIPAFAGGIFTNTTLTVNTYGQITAVSSGAGGLIPLVPDPTGTYAYPSSVQINQYGQTLSATAGTTPLFPNTPITAATINYNANGTIQYDADGLILSATSGALTIDPTGTYAFPSSIVINSYGQITSAVAGTPSPGSYVIPPVFIQATTMVNLVQNDLDIPVGTRQCVFTIIGGGGAKGADVLVGDTMYAGGMGGSGAYARVSIQATDDALIGFPAFQYQLVNNVTSANNGNGMNLMWSPGAIALYGTAVVGNFSGRLASCTGGAYGTDAVSGTGGSNGQGGLVVLGGQNQSTNQVSNGSIGVPPPPVGGFTYSTANNDYRGGQTASADILYNGGIISSNCDGESANYVNGITYVFGRGVGGIFIEYFY